jgi:hypothetical protein
MLRATLALLALTVSAHAGSEINLSCKGTASLFFGPPHLAGPKPVSTSLIVDLDNREVVFYEAHAEFSAGVSPQDSVLHFEWKPFLDAKGRQLPVRWVNGSTIAEDSDVQKVARIQGFEGTIDRVSGVASIVFMNTMVTPTTSPLTNPHPLDRGTQYELLCTPVKPLF